MTGGSFKGKVVLITGAGRGMGRVEANLFAERGASVVACDILEEEGDGVAAEIRSKGLDARFVPLDVTSAAGWAEAVARTVRSLGRIDVLVNNAGILTRRTVATYEPADWRRVLDVNLTGVFLGLQAMTPVMIGQRGGAIVNIASNAAFSGHPDPAYTASKWGLRGLSRTAALEFAPSGIRVNCVCPGLVRTDINSGAALVQPMIDMTPLGRSVEPMEIAATVAFLASDEAAMITGEEIVVDGGFTSGAGYWKIGRMIAAASAS